MFKLLLTIALIFTFKVSAAANYANQDCLKVANAAKATMMSRQLGNNKERLYAIAYRMSYDKKIIAIQLIDNAFDVEQVYSYHERVDLAAAYYEQVLSECSAQ
jgi:glucose-6-phosphate isomerase